MLRRALAIRIKALGEAHPDTAESYNNLATILRMPGEVCRGRGDAPTRPGDHLKALGEAHPDTAISYNNLAKCPRAQGKYAEAEAMHRRALAIRLKALGEDHPDTAGSYNNLADGPSEPRGSRPRPRRCTAAPWRSA